MPFLISHKKNESYRRKKYAWKAPCFWYELIETRRLPWLFLFYDVGWYVLANVCRRIYIIYDVLNGGFRLQFISLIWILYVYTHKSNLPFYFLVVGRHTEIQKEMEYTDSTRIYFSPL